MKSELAHFERYHQGFLNKSKAELERYPRIGRSERSAELVRRLEKAFRKRTCPPNINLLLGGDAVDSYYSPACVAEINKHDRTPRNNWQNIAPELLHACSYCLPYLEPQAFCYVLPAYLRVMLERPYYLEEDSILFHLTYQPDSSAVILLAPLSQEERDVVTDVLNELRYFAEFVDEVGVDSYMLPWEYERYASEAPDISRRQFCERLVLEYAQQNNLLG